MPGRHGTDRSRAAAGRTRPTRHDGALAHEQAAFVLVALGYQVCLSAPPLILEWKVGSLLLLTGDFVLASSVFRRRLDGRGRRPRPAQTCVGRGRPRRIHPSGQVDHPPSGPGRRSGDRRGLVRGPDRPAVSVRRSAGLPGGTFVALALSTVIAVGVSGVTVPALLAAGRGRHAAASWLAGALVMATTATVLPVGSGVIGWALLGGPVVALGCAGWALRTSSGDQA